MEDIIKHMVLCGWFVSASDEKISHPNIEKKYNNWTDAIKACIEVASDV